MRCHSPSEGVLPRAARTEDEGDVLVGQRLPRKEWRNR